MFVVVCAWFHTLFFLVCFLLCGWCVCLDVLFIDDDLDLLFGGFCHGVLELGFWRCFVKVSLQKRFNCVSSGLSWGLNEVAKLKPKPCHQRFLRLLAVF